MEHLQGTLTPLVHAHAGRTQGDARDKRAARFSETQPCNQVHKLIKAQCCKSRLPLSLNVLCRNQTKKKIEWIGRLNKQ